MTRMINRPQPDQRAREPLYDIDQRTGATIEVVFADAALAKCFGIRCSGWVWWRSHHGSLPDTLPTGPFATSYAAYRDALCGDLLTPARTAFGRRQVSPAYAHVRERPPSK